MRYLLLVAAVAGCLAPVHAQEKITLADPVHTDPGASEFRLASLVLDAQQPHILATLAEVAPGKFHFTPNGKILTCEYFGDDAAELLTQLNTMNFATVSLQKRVIQVCGKDGKIPPGIVSGTPSTFTPTPRAIPPGIGRGRGGRS
jgi:hypothetical protein